MYCKKCGTKLNDSDKFCKNCGESIWKEPLENKKEENSIEIKKNNEVDDSAENKKKPKRKGCGSRLLEFVFKLFMWLLLVTVIAAATILILDKSNIINLDKYFDNTVNENKVILRGDVLEDEDYEVEMPDADAYFESQALIMEKIGAKDSLKIQSEKTIADDLIERNFAAEDITTHYSMEGEYYDDTCIDQQSEDRHPVYQLLYVSTCNELWTVSVINGSVMATPVSYNMRDSSDQKQLILSEHEYLTSYDSATNTFYVTKPDETTIKVVVVERIDSSLLDTMTAEVMDNL